MANVKLKTVERKTTVTRNEVSGAFALARGMERKNSPSVAKGAPKQGTGTKKKSR